MPTKKELREATDIVWDICKGKERCPRERIQGQLKWIATVQERETRQEVSKFAAEVNTNVIGVITNWLEAQGPNQEIQAVANYFREVGARLTKQYGGE